MLIALLLPASSAATLTVEADGSGGYTSINAAISAASPGDTIEIGAGTWAEALQLGGTTLNLIGADGADSVIIDGTGSPSTIVSQGTVTLSDITLRNSGGRGLAASGFSDITLERVTFEDIGGDDLYGGAIQLTGGSVALIESTIDGGSAYAGMIFMSNASSLSATDTTIRQSTASYGAGIYASTGQITLEGSTLEQLYSSGVGGAIYLGAGTTLSAADTTFYANLTEYGSGSGIYAVDATITLTDSTFDLNYSTNYTDGYSGGAIALSGGYLSATRTLFTENSAYYGGAIQATGAILDFVDSELSDNFGYYGGALYADTSSTITDSGTRWVGNESYYAGGAIYAYSDYTMSFEGSAFIENMARYSYGGAVYGYYGDSEYTGVTFEDNYTYYYGGAVYAYYTYGTTRFVDSTFTENNARSHGGAIYAYAYNELSIESCTFARNESDTGYGGAVYNYYGNATVTASAFTGNRALESMGGAIYSYYYYGDAPDLVIADSSFSSNEARYHGGAVASVYNRFDISRSSFSVNDTENSGMGGAIFLQDTHTGEISQSLFSGNNAGYGGEIYSEGAYSLPSVWHNNIFVENTANIGGAVVVSNSDVTELVNNSFVGNSSVSEGGNIVLVASTISFINNALTHSPAGAGVYAFDTESIDGSWFSYNAWYDISDGIGGGSADESVLMTNALLDVEPGFTAYSPDGNIDNDSFVLLRDSALIDAGDPTIIDPNGSASDIGAWGGSDFVVEDADGDGHDSWYDCDDTDPSVYPGAADVFYDGINSDCLSGSDFDADADGADSAEHGGTDCDDTDPVLIEDCGGDTVIDTGEPEAEEPVESNSGNTSKDPGGCSHASGTLGGAWLVMLVALVSRRRLALDR